MNSRSKKFLQRAFLAGFGIIILAAGIGFYLQTRVSSNVEPAQTFEEPSVSLKTNYSFTDNRDVYAMDDPSSIRYLYITVMADEAGDEFKSFSEVNTYKFSYSTETPKHYGKAIFQEGNENGPQVGLYGYGEKNENATITVKGRSTSETAYKSYKLVLNERDGLWNGQKSINLNKHPYDISRVKNKLSSDYFKIIPNMASFRTQFVQVFIKDLSLGNNAPFVDYGLFTQTEQINKKYLKVHGFDPGGNLYKANFFEFYQYPEVIKTVDNPTYNAEEFNKLLEIQGSENHEPLIRMLEDVNDYSLDIDAVIDQHFNRENLVTWLASNLLFDQIDANSQNYFLYKPVNSNKWSFIPWDYDNAWGNKSQIGKDPSLRYSVWQEGVQNYWGNVLLNRYFRKEKNRDELDAKIQELRKIVTKEQTKEFLLKYYPIVSNQVNKMPDLNNIGVSLTQFTQEYTRLINLPDEHYEIYKKSLQKPMPVYMWTQERTGGKDIFGWDLSFDFQGDDIYYDFYLSKSPDMSSPIITQKDLSETEVQINKLPKGRYYWKVVIRDSKGNEMLPFDIYRDAFGKSYFGVREYEVK